MILRVSSRGSGGRRNPSSVTGASICFTLDTSDISDRQNRWEIC